MILHFAVLHKNIHCSWPIYAFWLCALCLVVEVHSLVFVVVRSLTFSEKNLKQIKDLRYHDYVCQFNIISSFQRAKRHTWY